MEFEVFNRSTELELAASSAKITFYKNDGTGYMNIAAKVLLALDDHDKIELLRFGKSLYVVKTDNAEGFALYKHTGHGKGGYRFYSKNSIAELFKTFSVK